jgi:hypothetical protein
MPVKVNDKYLVPAPLVTFDKSYIVNGDGRTIGANYSIGLEGKILPNKGNPVSTNADGTVAAFSTDPWVSTKSPDDDPNHGIDTDAQLMSIMSKQEDVRRLFSLNDGTADVEITDLNGLASGIKFIGKVQNLNFPSEGRWAGPCNYSVSLTTNNFKESINGTFDDAGSEDENSYYVSSASENWSIQEADTFTDVLNERGQGANTTFKIFKIAHNASAVGLPVYQGAHGSVSYKDAQNSFLGGVSPAEPWEQAREYVLNNIGIGFDLSGTGLKIKGFDNDSAASIFRLNGLSAVPHSYRAANRTVTENIDETAGSYSISEEFTIYPESGSFPIIEETQATVSRGATSVTSVALQGTIKGLDTGGDSDTGADGKGTGFEQDKILNAKKYFDSLTQTTIWKKAVAIAGKTWIHPEPLSKSFSINNNAGTISYSYTYDDRPPNIIPGSISEDISVSDTYPGQIFANIPVIGRNQPILQFVNSRTAYTRSLNINVNMRNFASNWGTIESNLTDGIFGGFGGDISAIAAASGYWAGADQNSIRHWMRQKPSIPSSGEFQKIFDAANPANETGVIYDNPVIATKVFHSAPQESWNSKTGAYSYSIQWTYERKY